MQRDPMDEEVLVIPTSYFHELGYFQGFTDRVERYIPQIFSEKKTSFRARRLVEPDPSYKQIIPYAILAWGNGDGWEVFHYTRGRGQGESRLRLKRSIGIGGHISREDAENGAEAFHRALVREIGEEVIIGSPYTLECVGLINDDQTEVGRVHLGVVYRLSLEKPVVTPREVDVVGHGFASPQQLANNWTEFETWSQIALAGVFGVVPPGQVDQQKA
ncbi:phosphoesterase [Thermogutta sp.]|uniref:phosphoesterase n=1 Tax=Thermogutta sp. TaxID=1962930 RepID=UPI00321FD5C4